MGKKKKRKLSVDFKGLNIGKNTARLSFHVDRGFLPLEDAAEMFVDSQLTCEIECDPNADKDVVGQQTIDGTKIELDVIADVTRFGVTADTFSAGLALNKGAVDLATLSQFANRKGSMAFERTGSASKDHDEE